MKQNKYVRNIRSENVDVYDVLEAYGVTCPAIQHALKKLLVTGERGYKDRLQDIVEAYQSIERAIELQEERQKRGSEDSQNKDGGEGHWPDVLLR